MAPWEFSEVISEYRAGVNPDHHRLIQTNKKNSFNGLTNGLVTAKKEAEIEDISIEALKSGHKETKWVKVLS